MYPVNKPEVMIAGASQKFDAEGNLTDPSMNRAVIGARVHSGWAAVLAVSSAGGLAAGMIAGGKDRQRYTVIDRRRIVIVDSAVVGANQPYHFAENLELPDAEKYLANCAAASEQLASAAVREMAGEVRARGFEVAGCAIVMAAGRPLPSLADILASHALIHTAEGEFFRRILRQACEAQGIAVTGIRERDLDDRAKAVFGSAAALTQQSIAGLGRSLGPPWTLDQKAAALAASIVLADLCGHTHCKSPSSSVD
jgi:hypothetical protein